MPSRVTPAFLALAGALLAACRAQARGDRGTASTLTVDTVPNETLDTPL
jgi:hypothetical protein